LLIKAFHCSPMLNVRQSPFLSHGVLRGPRGRDWAQG